MTPPGPILYSVAAVTALFVSVSCSSPNEGSLAPSNPTTTVQPQLSSLQTIFNRACAFASCHGGDEPQKGLSLKAGNTFSSVVNKDSTEPGWKLVVPGSPEKSLLYQVVLGSVGSISQMPKGGSLRSEEKEAIRQWILKGAKDD